MTTLAQRKTAYRKYKRIAAQHLAGLVSDAAYHKALVIYNAAIA